MGFSHASSSGKGWGWEEGTERTSLWCLHSTGSSLFSLSRLSVACRSAAAVSHDKMGGWEGGTRAHDLCRRMQDDVARERERFFFLGSRRMPDGI